MKMLCAGLVVLLAIAAASSADEEAPAIFESVDPVGEVIFLEDFQDPDKFAERWMETKDSEYSGRWEVEVPNKAGIANDFALLIPQEAKKYGISAAFDKPYDRKEQNEKALVIQYEVKTEEDHSCGGLYIKLLTDATDLGHFNGDTAYTIMFGPDRCGPDTDKVHFILRYADPNGEIEEKHAASPPRTEKDLNTHLYTLVINPDNSFEYLIDLESVKQGNLLEDMEPSINPAKMIDDPTDVKPEDWVDEAEIADPDASKPEDWDEEAPLEIPDPEAVKPEGWMDDEPDMIPDPDVAIPEDWDAEEDGEWEAPIIDNPACEEFGCGHWEPDMIRNPDYKGKWSAPLIDNPDYIGEWKAKQIENPDFFEDLNPHGSIPPISAVGIEIWTMSGSIYFDNILITEDLNVAAAYAKSTWEPKSGAEVKASQRTSPLEAFGEGIVKFWQDVISASADTTPAKLGAIGFFLLLFIGFYGITRAGRASVNNEKKKKAKSEEEDDDETENEADENEGESDAKTDSNEDEDTAEVVTAENETEEEEKPKKRRSARIKKNSKRRE